MDNWRSAYQQLYDKALAARGLPPEIVPLIVTSENGREDPGFINDNGDGTVDVGLMQINVPAGDTKEIQRLKDPTYNINQGMDRYINRLQTLGDPVLALASYNKGARGSIRDPQGSLARSQKIYANLGIPMPETEFTRDPNSYVAKNEQKWRQIGHLLPDDVIQTSPQSAPVVQQAPRPMQPSPVKSTPSQAPMPPGTPSYGSTTNRPANLPTSAPSNRPSSLTSFNVRSTNIPLEIRKTPAPTAVPTNPPGTMKYTNAQGETSFVNNQGKTVAPQKQSDNSLLANLAGMLNNIFGKKT